MPLCSTHSISKQKHTHQTIEARIFHSTPQETAVRQQPQAPPTSTSFYSNENRGSQLAASRKTPATSTSGSAAKIDKSVTDQDTSVDSSPEASPRTSPEEKTEEEPEMNLGENPEESAQEPRTDPGEPTG